MAHLPFPAIVTFQMLPLDWRLTVDSSSTSFEPKREVGTAGFDLVGGWAYRSEKYEFVNWDDYSSIFYLYIYIYIYGKIEHVPNHQPVMFSSLPQAPATPPKPTTDAGFQIPGGSRWFSWCFDQLFEVEVYSKMECSRHHGCFSKCLGSSWLRTPVQPKVKRKKRK